jgi:hypothetical protein
MNVNKKWLLLLTSMFISAMLVGCNFGDQDPPPPETEQNGDQDQQPETNPAPEEEQDPDTGENPAEELEEDIEEPFEDPDGDGKDENDPNPEEN